MGLFNLLDPVLDAVLGSIVRTNPTLGLILITFVISLAIVLIYRAATDQERMRHLREEIKKAQEKLKKLKKDPEKMMREQRKVMPLQTELMKHSFKPTLYTFIPIIIIFGWLSSNLAVLPIEPGEEFNMTVEFHRGASGNVEVLVQDGVEIVSDPVQEISDRTVSWTLRGEAGEQFVYFDYNGEQFQKRVIISDEHVGYARADKTQSSAFNIFNWLYSSREGSLPSESSARRVTVHYEPVHPLPFSILGWEPGWLGTYIIFSILFSLGLRKVLKVY